MSVNFTPPMTPGIATHAIPSHEGPGRFRTRQRRRFPRWPWRFGDTAACRIADHCRMATPRHLLVDPVNECDYHLV
ncbi:MAG: hypothetical protein OXU77_10170, partial [Gammaproteobacteria bacterium]|nr:hypothetical protein [Gammaproteobacteria bacterium]